MKAVLSAIALAAGLALAVPAMAQQGQITMFIAQEYGWVISGFMGTCKASNRPVRDFAIAPYNGIEFTEQAGSDAVSATIYFWPGAFPEQGGPITLNVGPYQQGLDLAATTYRGYIAMLDQPVPAELLAEWGVAEELLVRTDGVKQLVGFDMALVDRVLIRLRQCAYSIPVQ